MEHLITAVAESTPAYRSGLRAGDTLLSINGEEIIDQIDYEAFSGKRHLVLHVRKANGQDWHVEIVKPQGKPLGLSFGESMELTPRICKNKCIFCFIDQMPPACRETLYVKDDDWRMSLMMGNFITMTNMDDDEFARVLKRRVSPLFISVHTVEPDLRVRMMANPNAAKIMERLNALRDHGIRFHCQIVLCPGINDGEHLEKTLETLFSLCPAAQSAALVPVGLTKYRQNLYPLRPYTRDEAIEILRICEKWQRIFLEKSGSRFVFPSDEMLCIAGADLPDEAYYENYPQIENGVGLMRQFLNSFTEASSKNTRTATVQPIRNRFFGETVTVTGLLTGNDILDQADTSGQDEMILCSIVLRAEGDLFLDDLSLTDFRNSLSIPVTVCPNRGEMLFEALLGPKENS